MIGEEVLQLISFQRLMEVSLYSGLGLLLQPVICLGLIAPILYVMQSTSKGLGQGPLPPHWGVTVCS